MSIATHMCSMEYTCDSIKMNLHKISVSLMNMGLNSVPLQMFSILYLILISLPY